MSDNSDPIKKPPKFSENLCYETFKTKTKAWQKVTTVKEDSQGLVLALNLPNNEANNIGERIFQELTLAELEGANGANKFWDYMDNQFKKDDMVQMCETIKAFTLFKRRETQPIKDYVNEFESLYMKAKKKGLSALPPEYMTYLLFDNSGLKIKDQRLAMVEVDFTKKEEMFDRAKRNILKLFGGIKSLTDSNDDVIRLADENNTFFNRGQNQKGATNSRSNFYRPRNAFGNLRFSPPQHRVSGTATGSGSSPRILANKLDPQKFEI